MLATVYGVDVRTINYHIKKIFEDNELRKKIQTIRNFEIVQKKEIEQFQEKLHIIIYK